MEPIRSTLPERNKRSGSVVADQRLEAWLAFLRDVRFQENFRIHTHSSIVLEPKLLLDLFSGDVPLTHLLVLARSIASSEWSGRFCSTDDENAVQTLLAAKESFFVFPAKAIALDKSPLLFSFVSCVSQIPHWCNYLRREGVREGELEVVTSIVVSKALNFSLPDDCKCWNILTPSSSGGVLDVFSSCLGTLMQASNFSFPILPRVKKQAVSEILLRPGVIIRSAADSFPLPYTSLIDAITSFGVKVSPWCFDIPKEKPKSLIEAVRCSANVAILIVPLRSDEQHQTWPLRQNEKELCIIAERGDRFGGVLRLQVAEKQAHVTVLTPIPHFRKITLNSGPLQEHVNISDGLIIEFTVDLNVRVNVHVVRES